MHPVKTQIMIRVFAGHSCSLVEYCTQAQFKMFISHFQVRYLDIVVVTFDQGIGYPAIEYVQAKILKEMNSGKTLVLCLLFWSW